VIAEAAAAGNCSRIAFLSLPPAVAKLAARLAPSLTPALMDLLLADNVAATSAAEVGERFGCTPHRFEDVWSR
jgi:hypothetical protein